MDFYLEILAANPTPGFVCSVQTVRNPFAVFNGDIKGILPTGAVAWVSVSGKHSGEREVPLSLLWIRAMFLHGVISERTLKGVLIFFNWEKGNYWLLQFLSFANMAHCECEIMHWWNKKKRSANTASLCVFSGGNGIGVFSTNCL